MWPFSRKKPAPLDPIELRDLLIAAAASGSRKKLRSECQKYKSQIAEHAEILKKMPEDIPKDDDSIDRHIQCLVAVAQCLANECSAPELWNSMTGVSDDNPFVQWERWFSELPERMQRLDYDSLISEAQAFIEKTKSLRGSAARRYEVLLFGRLGELYFHSGRVNESLEPFQTALALCLESKDVEGQVAYLNNILEARCYLDDGKAVATAKEILDVKRQNRLATKDVEKRLGLLKSGEPLCRVTCAHDGKELELDEITNVGEGSYRFQFRRNRLSLHKATTLTRQGNELASAGNYSDALEKYHEASEVDPHDPDPVYQSAMCLVELGAYGKGREAFEEVEQLAPGWFRCRSDRWLADGMDKGTISNEEFLLLRTLDDGGLPPAEATSIVRQAVVRFPEFAPLYLFLGNYSRDERDAVAAYRKGLELVDEPDLESRLLCALAGRLPADAPERKQLVERAVSLNGSLVAIATARLIGLR